MSNSSRPSRRIHPLSIFAAIFVAGLLLLLAYVLILMGSGTGRQADKPQAGQFVTIIPAPTETPVVIELTAALTATPEAPMILPSGTVGVGAYVKVGRTEGAGLRVRAEASTSADVRFIAMDEEVFKVVGGPVQANNYTWWQVEAPYDSARTGWAVDTFLEVISQLTPTP